MSINKKFFVGALVAAFVLVGGSVANAAYMHTVTLKQGSSGAQVMSLQQTLNMTACKVATSGAGAPGMETTTFGAKTKVAVQCFQAWAGLTADGVVGPMTGAKLAAVTGTSTGTFPAGCTSSAGYSTTTGQPCSTGSSVPGCTSTVGYSPINGQPCNASTGGSLQGTAGDISVTSYNSGLETQVGEGMNDAKVLGFEIEADAGSDVAITSVKVSFENQGTGSKRFTRYADAVSIWTQDGTKVGSSNASDFSESSNVYSRSISISNVIVRADRDMRFYVSVDAAENIDSADYSGDNWKVTVDSVRFNDASGAILTENSGLNRNFGFSSLASANDLELKVNLSGSNLKAQTVKVSTTTNTNNVEVLKFTMKAQGGNMRIDQIPVLIDTSNTVSTAVSAVTGNVTLTIDGSSYSESIATTTATSVAVTFDDLDLDLDKDDTVTGTVTVDLNALNASNYAQGQTIKASIPSAYVTATSGTYVDVEDRNGDQLVSGDRSGSAIGEVMTLRSTGVNAVMGTPSYNRTTNNSGEVTSVTYTIPVSVTSFGNTLYVGQSAQLAASASGSNAFALVFQTSGAPTSSDVTSSAAIALSSSNAVIESNGFRLDDGSTKNFTITVTLNTPTTTNANYRVALKQIQTFTDALLTSGAASSALLPDESFRTDYQFINN